MLAMERKIGEIFEYNGEWYQCIGNPYNVCTDCDFCFEIGRACVRQIVGQCSMSNRSDGLSVVFKKLEKVGEPFFVNIQGDNVLEQRYKLYEPMVTLEGYWYRIDGNFINIEIKQNKEDMEDLDKIKVRDYTKVEELNVMEENKLNLKPFDIQKAREGKPVCTRDGRKARIICFDRDWDMHIVALVSDPLGESVHYYLSNGKVDFDKQNDEDLMMYPEKKEGWMNVYKDSVYDTKDEALIGRSEIRDYIDTIKISWEE